MKKICARNEYVKEDMNNNAHKSNETKEPMNQREASNPSNKNRTKNYDDGSKMKNQYMKKWTDRSQAGVFNIDVQLN